MNFCMITQKVIDVGIRNVNNKFKTYMKIALTSSIIGIVQSGQGHAGTLKFFSIYLSTNHQVL